MYDYYDYSSTADTYNQANDLFSTTMQAAMPVMIVSVIIELAVAAYVIFITWRVYEKAGRKGWESIIPFYNIYVFFTIAGLEWWYILLLFVPFVNLYVIVHLALEFARRFNKSTAFGFGILFLNPIFMSILAFEKDTVYTPVDGSNNMNGNNNYNNNYNQSNMNGYNGMNVNNMNSVNNNGMNQPNNMGNNSNNYGPNFNPTNNTSMNNIPSFNSNNNSANNSNNMGINNDLNTRSSVDAFRIYGNNDNNNNNTNNDSNDNNNKPLQ